MIKFRCNHCGTYFDEPKETVYEEVIAERLYRSVEKACPICGCDGYVPANYCPVCNSPKAADERICGECRTSLRGRFTDFADSLTADEEDQLDDWLDGDSITNRRSWR